MTYQESVSQALKLKDFVRLNDDQAWIYFIFTSQTDFYLQIYDKAPSVEIQHQIQAEAFYIKKIPMACINIRFGRERIVYRDLNLQLEIDLNSGKFIRFEGEESTPIDISKVKNSLRKLTGKFK